MFDWTIMVYLGGDNNLSEEMIWALKDIQTWRRSIGPDIKKKVKVVALFDGGGPPVTIDFDKFPHHRGPIKRGPIKSKMPGDHTSSNGHEESVVLSRTARVRREADRRKAKTSVAVEPVRVTLKRFLLKSMRRYRADHFMLVLNGHGSGAIGDFLTGDKRVDGLTIPALAKVLDDVRVRRRVPKTKRLLDILGLDSCQMSMAEVACQVQKSVRYMIGSEGFQPNTGWPYQDVLNLLTNPACRQDPGKFAENIARAHVQYYLDFAAADLSTDIATLNLTHFKEIETALQSLTRALGIKPQSKKDWEKKQKLPDNRLSRELDALKAASRLSDPLLLDTIVLAHHEAQGFKREQYTDVWDFCDCLQRRLNRIHGVNGRNGRANGAKPADPYAAIKQACSDVKDVIDSDNPPADPKARFVRRSGYTGPQFQHSHGLSIFYPWASLTDAVGTADIDHYQELKFARATAWDEYVRIYLHATKRPVRTRNTEHQVFPSLLNRRTGLFVAKPGKDPEVATGDKDPEVATGDKGRLGFSKIESMKNPPTNWRAAELETL